MEENTSNNSATAEEPMVEMNGVQPGGVVNEGVNINQDTQVLSDEIVFLSCGIEKVDEIIATLDNRDAAKENVTRLTNEVKRLTNELKQQKNKLESDINAEIKRKQIEATAKEDEEISKTRNALKEERTKRNRAKDKGVRDRITAETKHLVEENTETHRAIRKMLSDNGLPGYCDSAWFFTMYASNGMIEVLIKLSVFIIGLFAVPGIILFIADPWWLWKMIWWAVIDAGLIMVYITIYLFTKDKDNGTLEDVRMERYKISDNNKKIMEIKKNINNDTDESQYNLEEFDQEIQRYEAKLEELAGIRNEKLRVFEEDTKGNIIQEMRYNAEPVFNEKQGSIDSKQAECDEQSNLLKKLNEDIVINYQKFMGDKYTSRANLNKIRQLLESGQAPNIGTAVDILKAR